VREESSDFITLQHKMMFAPVVCLLLVSISNGFRFSAPRVVTRKSVAKSITNLHAATVDTEEGIKKKEYSFVNEDLRTYAMRFHTKDQAPKEGQQKAETPFTSWEPTRQNYVQFLVDSLLVYETLESLAQEIPALAPFKVTGLERAAALKEDLEWMKSFDPTIVIPECGPNGIKYSAFLTQVRTVEQISQHQNNVESSLRIIKL
jgi:hypothetical protein